MSTILLLIASSTFLTFAWYGHVKFKSVPLWQAIAASWGIAFFERFSAFQLKVMPEVITLVVFVVFALFAFVYLGEAPR